MNNRTYGKSLFASVAASALLAVAVSPAALAVSGDPALRPGHTFKRARIGWHRGPNLRWYEVEIAVVR